MPATGKYTVYAPPSSEKNTLLNKLFRSDDPVVKPIVQDMVGQENEVREAIIAIAKVVLTPTTQYGDPAFWPQGVDMTFGTAPDLTTVGWAQPGDPAFAYAPDISSPGPGKTAGVDKDSDPELTIADIKPNYVPAAPDTGTVSPSTTSERIDSAVQLGVAGILGKSGADT